MKYIGLHLVNETALFTHACVILSAPRAVMLIYEPRHEKPVFAYAKTNAQIDQRL